MRQRRVPLSRGIIIVATVALVAIAGGLAATLSLRHSRPPHPGGAIAANQHAVTPTCSARLLFAAAVAGQHFSTEPGKYPPYPGQGPGAYHPVCTGTWAVAVISHPEVGTTDGGALFRSMGGKWVFVAGVGGVPADCLLERLGVPTAVARLLWPPSHSAGVSYCNQEG